MQELYEIRITRDVDDVHIVLGNSGSVQQVWMPGEC